MAPNQPTTNIAKEELEVLTVIVCHFAFGLLQHCILHQFAILLRLPTNVEVHESFGLSIFCFSEFTVYLHRCALHIHSFLSTSYRERERETHNSKPLFNFSPKL